MVSKLFFVIGLAVVALTLVSGAPRAFKNEDDLKKSVVEFLSQDKAFLGALEHSGLIDNEPLALHRRKRQSEVTGMDIDDSVDVDNGAPKDGFFDRAAKFVVDLLQRFLKWINASDN